MTNAEKAESGNPLPWKAGSFAIYDTPGKGTDKVLVIRELGEENDTKHTIPGMVFDILNRLEAGEQINPMDLLKLFMGK